MSYKDKKKGSAWMPSHCALLIAGAWGLYDFLGWL